MHVSHLGGNKLPVVLHVGQLALEECNGQRCRHSILRHPETDSKLLGGVHGHPNSAAQCCRQREGAVELLLGHKSLQGLLLQGEK